MFVLYRLPVLVIAACMTCNAHSENMQLDANLLLTGFDAGGNDDFHSGRAINVNYSYYLKDWLAADAGLMISSKTLDENQTDIVGTYRASTTNIFYIYFNVSYTLGPIQDSENTSSSSLGTNFFYGHYCPINRNHMRNSDDLSLWSYLLKNGIDYFLRIVGRCWHDGLLINAAFPLCQ